MTNKELHLKTKAVAEKYRQIESELVKLLIQMDERKAYRELGYASLFQYSVHELKLSEAVTSAFITVSRKAAQVPDLMQALEEQVLTVSKAAKVVSVLNPESAPEVIAFAAEHSTAETEKWLQEKKGVEIQHTLKISAAVMEKLKKARSLSKTEISLDEALDLVLDEYIKRHDPEEKARRSKTRPAASPNASYEELHTVSYPVLHLKKRKPLRAHVKHQVIARDQNRCTFQIKPGLRCAHTKYLEIHHIIPRQDGGQDHSDNLTTLCSAHHKQLHEHR